MSILAAINDLFRSVYELAASIAGTALHTVQSLVSAVVGLFTGFVRLIQDLLHGAIDVVGGVGRFVIGNIVILTVLSVAGYAFLRLRQQQQRQGGKAVTVGDKKKA
ncbi:hypothetical protein VTK73DRAFT_1875 [Phialemonium thermophilum]|uniref:Uncharacterized protein n=1 Tax=Phialemonium thermophilum TaxID=223376 RepID=A0ABR3VSU7_9PEZI